MKIILFDIDDTLLVCPQGANTKGSEIMFKRVFDLEANEGMINTKGKTDKQIISEVIRKVKGHPGSKEIEIPERAYQVWAEVTGKILKTNPPLVLPGVWELLDTLSKNKNVLMALLTGNAPYRARVKVESVGMDKYFKDEEGNLLGVFGDKTEKRADLISDAKNKFGDRVYIIIDDSLIAAQMAKDNNVLAILVATGTASLEELKSYSDFVFKDFGENRWKEVVAIIENFPN